VSKATCHRLICDAGPGRCAQHPDNIRGPRQELPSKRLPTLYTACQTRISWEQTASKLTAWIGSEKRVLCAEPPKRSVGGLLVAPT